MLSSNTIENTQFYIFFKLLDLHGHGNKTATIWYNSLIFVFTKEINTQQLSLVLI